jgi:hypothetical protein
MRLIGATAGILLLSRLQDAQMAAIHARTR